MATLSNDGNINWNGNWQTTAQADTLHASANIVVDSTGGADYTKTWTGVDSKLCRGCIVYLATVSGTNSRNITVTLQENTGGGMADTTAAVTVTVTSNTKAATYVFFKLDEDYAENSAYTYQFKFTSDNADDTTFRADSSSTSLIAKIEVYSDATTLSDGDTPYIVGNGVSWSAGNPNEAVVTYNVVSGDGTAGDAAHDISTTIIGSGGALRFAVSASTTYWLAINNNLTVYNGGELAVGTIASPMPNSSSGTIDMSGTKNITVQSGGKWFMQGAKKFTPDTAYRCTSTDAIESVGDRTVSTSIDVEAAGWLANDSILISRNSASAATSEIKIISSVSGSTLTITTDWTNTHLSGSHIVNLTRPSVFNGSNSSSFKNNNTVDGMVDFDYARIEQIQSTTAHVTNLTQRFDFDNSVMYDNRNYGNGGAWNILSPLLYKNIVIFSVAYASFGVATAGIVFDNCVFGSNFNQGHTSIAILYLTYFKDSVFLTGGTSSGTYNSITNSGIAYLDNVIMVGCGVVGGSGYSIVNYGYLYGNDVILGGDGTNTLGSYNADITTSGMVILNNAKLLSNTPVIISGDTTEQRILSTQSVSVNRFGMMDDRHKSYQEYGNISDQITGGQAADWARGGSGLCIYLDPTSTTYPLILDFNVPVTSGASFQLQFYSRATATGAGAAYPNLAYSIYDSHNHYTPLITGAQVNLSSASNWSQYTSASCSPTSTGFCKVTFNALDGSNTGDIGIDDISVV